MPKCYLLTLCSGSSLDQHSNNVTLFNLVEQINLQPGSQPPPQTLIPVELHAYFRLSPQEVGHEFEIRFALVALDSGLESYSDVFVHRSATPRYRTRTLGLPLPPASGGYELVLDWRLRGSETWQREPLSWPILVGTAELPGPRVTH